MLLRWDYVEFCLRTFSHSEEAINVGAYRHLLPNKKPPAAHTSAEGLFGQALDSSGLKTATPDPSRFSSPTRNENGGGLVSLTS